MPSLPGPGQTENANATYCGVRLSRLLQRRPFRCSITQFRKDLVQCSPSLGAVLRIRQGVSDSLTGTPASEPPKAGVVNIDHHVLRQNLRVGEHIRHAVDRPAWTPALFNVSTQYAVVFAASFPPTIALIRRRLATRAA